VNDNTENNKTAQIIDLLMNELPEVERNAIEKAIAQDKTHAAEHADFQLLLQKTRKFAAPPQEIPDISSRIMNTISGQERQRWWEKTSPATFAQLAGLAAALVLVFKLTQQAAEPSFLTIGMPDTGNGYTFKANYNDARIEAPGNLLVNGIAGTTLPLPCFLAALVFLILGRLKQSRNYYSAALICFIITLFSALWM